MTCNKCNKPAEFDIPEPLCEEHWNGWFNGDEMKFTPEEQKAYLDELGKIGKINASRMDEARKENIMNKTLIDISQEAVNRFSDPDASYVYIKGTDKEETLVIGNLEIKMNQDQFNELRSFFENT